MSRIATQIGVAVLFLLFASLAAWYEGANSFERICSFHSLHLIRLTAGNLKLYRSENGQIFLLLLSLDWLM
ncbi:hypothetical protein MUN89_13005 [Halobacillus salinarum]|uniref:Uncharacterized protein n=1 Tax=Halobacillus salinarum TaxID=2932257 RepID=A0ABY4EEH8_9BACI|nr:hypothetical protein [Halobacillus salinarum]UOQ42880.1 hypothetical protein MUN89_13005 [Halobacillus salinarum]